MNLKGNIPCPLIQTHLILWYRETHGRPLQTDRLFMALSEYMSTSSANLFFYFYKNLDPCHTIIQSAIHKHIDVYVGLSV